MSALLGLVGRGTAPAEGALAPQLIPLASLGTASLVCTHPPDHCDTHPTSCEANAPFGVTLRVICSIRGSGLGRVVPRCGGVHLSRDGK